jgi:hypothetical protein
MFRYARNDEANKEAILPVSMRNVRKGLFLVFLTLQITFYAQLPINVNKKF